MTTPVGSIRIDMILDGSDMWTQLGADAARHLKPIQMEIVRTLQKIERAEERAARAAEKAGAKQTAAAKSVADAVEDIGDEQTRTAAKTAAAGQMTTRQLNAMTRAIDKQTAAWAANTAARAANAAAPTGGPPPRGGGGGSGGGGRSGGGGGFLGFGGPIAGAAGWNGVAAIVGSFPAAATAVTNLTGAIQNLAQTGLVVPGVIASIGASFGTAKLGFQGMTDAIKALNEAAASGDPKDLEKAAEALKGMAPAAVEVATSVARLTQGPLKDLQRATAQKMFDGVADEIDELTTKAFPTLERGTAQVASAWNGTFKELGRTIGDDSTLSFVDRIFGNTADAQQRADAAIAPLIHGFGELAATGSDFMPRLADGLTNVANRFDEWITKASSDGRLTEWIDTGLDAVGDLGESFLNVVKIVGSLTEAAGGDGGLLSALERGSTALADFLASADGQNTLREFFTDGREQLRQWGPILANLAQIAGNVYESMHQWADVLLPFLRTATDILAGIPGGIEAVTTAFLAWKTINGISALLGQLGNVGTALDGLPGRARKSAGGVNGAFAKSNLANVGTALGTAGIGWGLSAMDGDDRTSDTLGMLATLGGGAALGASVGGLPGAAVGLVGGAGAAIWQTIDEQQRQQQALRDRVAAQAGHNGVPAVIAPGPGPAVAPPMELPHATDVQSILTGLNQVGAQAQSVRQQVQQLGNDLVTLPDGQVVLRDNTTEAIDKVKALGLAVTKLPDGQVAIRVQYTYNGAPISLEQLRAPIRVQAVPGDTYRGPGRATGGPIFGGIAGFDSVPIMAMPGEHMLTVADVKALGGHAGVYALRRSLHGYADGGAIGAPAAPASPFGDLLGIGAALQPVVDLLTQIRDSLTGTPVEGVDQTDTAVAAARQAFDEVSGGTPHLGTGALPGPAPDYLSTGTIPALSADASGLIAFAQRASGGQYSFGASDLAQGLSDCSGAVSDLVELITKGQAGPERLFSTANAANVLESLGAVPGLVPGTLQIGFKNGGPGGGHMAATLPNGVNFESGGGTGQGATYGGAATGAGDPQFTDHWSLPVNGVIPPGLPGDALPVAPGGSGTPVYVTNWPGTAVGGDGAALPGLDGILGAGTQAAGQAAGTVATDVLGGFAGVGTEEWVKRAPDAALANLIRERNPLALAAALGLNVQDFTRQGGQGGDFLTNTGPAFDASGRLFSDTAGLSDRTTTSLNAQIDAMRKQLVDVINQTNDKLNDDALQPIVKAGMQAALEDLKDSVSASIGASLGKAAAPPIADAVGSAVSQLPIDKSGAGGTGGAAAGLAKGIFGMAAGGPVFGGVPGKDSVPALLMPGEHVFTTQDVARLGGQAGVYRFRAALAAGQVQGFATGGGVNVNDTVGAEFFGVSQIPIIGMIVNLLVRVLLSVLGVQIEARDTLQEMTSEFRQFRGDAFKAFDAQGRLLNDTSGLIERSSTSEETAADERIRILKIVIQALVKYIIEKVIVPIGKAVANAVIQAGASAAGAGISAAPGGQFASGIVESLISSAGSAAVDIIAEVGTDFALAISETLIDVFANGLQSVLPDLMNTLFSGGLLSFVTNPIGDLLGNGIGGILGSLASVFGGLFGGAATLIPGIPFDEGGVATGMGLLPKATLAPERVLSPRQTAQYERNLDVLDRLARGRGVGGDRTVNATVTVVSGARETPEQAADRLLSLLS